MRVCGPTKAAFWLVESGLLIVAVVSDIAAIIRNYSDEVYPEIINELKLLNFTETSVSGFPLQPLTDTAAASAVVQFWEATV